MQRGALPNTFGDPPYSKVPPSTIESEPRKKIIWHKLKHNGEKELKIQRCAPPSTLGNSPYNKFLLYVTTCGT